MEESKENNQVQFILLTSLSQEDFRTAEIMFKKNNIKNLSIYHKKKFVDKLLLIYEEDEETSQLFRKENNNTLEIPNNSDPKLIASIIHYIYFREVISLPFREIANFLDLALFFQIKDLPQKIITFLKENVDTAEKATFLRISIYPLMKRTDFPTSDSLKEIIILCEDLFLRNNHMEEYLSFYSHQYNSFYHDCSDVENDLFNSLDLMIKHKSKGICLLKLLSLFKDRLCVLKREKNNFNFTTYAEEIIEKYVKLGEINNTSLAKSFTRLELNLNNFKLNIANEKIAELEKTMKEM